MQEKINPKKMYVCCHHCMEINPKLLVPCAKYIEGIDLKLKCPKKERNEPHSEKLKPDWKEITEEDFMVIYELSKDLNANIRTMQVKDDKIYFVNLKRKE